jgi:hypothetical protein
VPNLNQLQEQANTLLTHSLSEPQGFAVMPEQRTTLGRRSFSVFNPVHMQKVHELADKFSAIAHESGNDVENAIANVFRVVEQSLQTEDKELVQYALMSFMLHDPAGRRLEIPPIELRAPQLVFPSTSLLGPLVVPQTINTEPDLEWFREDPKLSEHHEHWHIVYSWAVQPGQLKDRQGEIFIYMHQQMLARYDTERLALGRPLTIAFDGYRTQITEIYDPGKPLNKRYGPRTKLTFMQDTPDYTLGKLESGRDEIRGAINQGFFEDVHSKHLPVSPEKIGATIEASSGSASFAGNVQTIQNTRYGSVHNFGHDLISQVMDPDGHLHLNPGVMSQPVVSQRDPIFWRWHRQIDDFSYRWQEKQQPHIYGDAVAGVSVRKLFRQPNSVDSLDIILAFKDAIGALGNPSFDGYQFGQQNFGGSNWNKDFSASAITTPLLETYMLRRPLMNQQIEYLDQREFVYFFRVQNSNPQPVEVTLRIYLIGKEFVGRPDERRYWIEMDKFRETLAPGNNVIYRPAELSSVIQKPARKPPRTTATGPTDGDPCTCGWPYNLLLPRGRKAGQGEEGMPFRLLLFLTDWNKDKVEESNCGSLSFCGAKERYPDARSMGYPFDRPFAAGITNLIEQSATMAARDFSIVWKQSPRNPQLSGII